MLTKSQVGICAGIGHQTCLACIEKGIARKLRLMRIGKEHHQRSDKQNDPLCGLIFKCGSEFPGHRLSRPEKVPAKFRGEQVSLNQAHCGERDGRLRGEELLDPMLTNQTPARISALPIICSGMTGSLNNVQLMSSIAI